MKLYLSARPKNEGARKLAQWVMTHCHGRLNLAAIKTALNPNDIQRLIDGDVIPGAEGVRRVQERISDRITRRDWQQPACGGWFEPAEEPGSLGRKAA